MYVEPSFSIEGTTTVIDDDLTVRITTQNINTTVYDVARRAYKKWCKQHDHVVFTSSYDGTPYTVVGGRNPHITNGGD